MERGARTERSADWRRRVRESQAGRLVVLGVTAILVTTCVYVGERSRSDGGGTSVQRAGDSSGRGPQVGEPAQDFVATTIDGRTTSLASYRGQAVWLTFGSTWCSDCRAEAPDIQAAYETAKADGVVVLAVYLSEDAGTVRAYAERLGLTYPQVHDPSNEISSAYRVRGIPAHYFIDRAGVLRSVKVGVLDRGTMDSALSEISR